MLYKCNTLPIIDLNLIVEGYIRKKMKTIINEILAYVIFLYEHFTTLGYENWCPSWTDRRCRPWRRRRGARAGPRPGSASSRSGTSTKVHENLSVFPNHIPQAIPWYLY